MLDGMYLPGSGYQGCAVFGFNKRRIQFEFQIVQIGPAKYDPPGLGWLTPDIRISSFKVAL
jgi:hypothetical protein